jgi:hypothetical protein
VISWPGRVAEPIPVRDVVAGYIAPPRRHDRRAVAANRRATHQDHQQPRAQSARLSPAPSTGAPRCAPHPCGFRALAVQPGPVLKSVIFTYSPSWSRSRLSCFQTGLCSCRRPCCGESIDADTSITRKPPVPCPLASGNQAGPASPSKLHGEGLLRRRASAGHHGHRDRLRSQLT